MINPDNIHIVLFKQNIANVDGHELKNFVLDTLNSSYGKYIRRLKACSNEFSENSVHDLRVSIRRLKSIIKLVSAFTTSPYLEVIETELNQIFDVFGELRDVQVMIMKIQKMRVDYPELSYFYYELLADELNKHNIVEKHLHNLNNKHLKQEIFFLNLDLKLHMNINDHDGSTILEKLRASYEKVQENLINIDRHNVDTIHKVRISFKKFRYLFELSLPLGKLSKKEIKHLQHYQDLMGAIQDTQVLEQKFSDFINNQPPLKKRIFINIRSLLQDRLDNAVDVFIDRMDDFDHFNYFKNMDSESKFNSEDTTHSEGMAKNEDVEEGNTDANEKNTPINTRKGRKKKSPPLNHPNQQI